MTLPAEAPTPLSAVKFMGTVMLLAKDKPAQATLETASNACINEVDFIKPPVNKKPHRNCLLTPTLIIIFDGKDKQKNPGQPKAAPGKVYTRHFAVASLPMDCVNGDTER